MWKWQGNGKVDLQQSPKDPLLLQGIIIQILIILPLQRLKKKKKEEVRYSLQVAHPQAPASINIPQKKKKNWKIIAIQRLVHFTLNVNSILTHFILSISKLQTRTDIVYFQAVNHKARIAPFGND